MPAGAEIAPRPEPVDIGSDAHKTLFCRTLLDTFNPYRPAVLDWPRLDETARERLVRLPIWDIAVQTEGKAGLRVKAIRPDGTIVVDEQSAESNPQATESVEKEREVVL